MSAEEKELLRHAVIECLVNRHPVALPVSGIARRVRMELDFKCSDEDVMGALELLKGLGLVESQADPLGSSKWWRATADGVLKREREGKI